MAKVLSRRAESRHARAAAGRKPRFRQAIEAVEGLALDQRETLVDVLRKRNADARRRQIEAEIRESLERMV